MGWHRRNLEMAPTTLVLDASVGVKWFSAIGEDRVLEAREIMKAQVAGEINLVVPDLFLHEISNALVFKKNIPLSMLQESLSYLFDLELSVFSINEQRTRSAVEIARKIGITEYDAYYLVAAIENHCPLVTANPRHQISVPGCEVIPIEEWKSRF